MKANKKIDQEIVAEREVKINLEAKIAAASNNRDEAKATQRELAYRACTGDDPSLTQKLEETEQAILATEQRLASLKIVLERADEKLGDLENKRIAGEREVAVGEYETACKALIDTDADTVERALTMLIAAVAKIKARGVELDRLANAAGLDPKHRNIGKHLRRAIDQRLGHAAIIYPKQFKEFYVGPLKKIFEATINGVQIEETESLKTGT